MIEQKAVINGQGQVLQFCPGRKSVMQVSICDSAGEAGCAVIDRRGVEEVVKYLYDWLEETYESLDRNLWLLLNSKNAFDTGYVRESQNKIVWPERASIEIRGKDYILKLENPNSYLATRDQEAAESFGSFWETVLEFKQ